MARRRPPRGGLVVSLSRMLRGAVSTSWIPGAGRGHRKRGRRRRSIGRGAWYYGASKRPKR